MMIRQTPRDMRTLERLARVLDEAWESADDGLFDQATLLLDRGESLRELNWRGFTERCAREFHWPATTPQSVFRLAERHAHRMLQREAYRNRAEAVYDTIGMIGEILQLMDGR